MVVSYLSACFHKIKPFHSWCTQNMQYYETGGAGGAILCWRDRLPEKQMKQLLSF